MRVVSLVCVMMQDVERTLFSTPRKPRGCRLGALSRVTAFLVRAIRGLPLVGLALAVLLGLRPAVLASRAFVYSLAPFNPPNYRLTNRQRVD